MQSSVAISPDLTHWVVLNASPDIRQQLAAHPAFWPRGPRQTTVSAVVLTDAEIDHTLGLMLLRESAERLSVYAPAGVTALLEREWPLFRVLDAYAGVQRCPLSDRVKTPLKDISGRSLGLSCTAIPLARRPPRYARSAPTEAYEVGLRLEARGAVVAYIPTAAALDDAVRELAREADLLLFDGTFWSDDELRHAGVEAVSAKAMGHLPIGGADGSLAALPSLGAKQTVYIHINNTNPILDRASPEYQAVVDAGLLVGEDGMEFEL